jgi:hypothetical protein
MNRHVQMNNGPTVALYEDPFVQNYLYTLLARNGFQVKTCSPGRVIEMVRSPGTTIDLLITNSPLAFQAVCAELPILYMSAFPNPDVPGLFAKCRVLTKPFRPEELLSLVKELIASM